MANIPHLTVVHTSFHAWGADRQTMWFLYSKNDHLATNTKFRAPLPQKKICGFFIFKIARKKFSSPHLWLHSQILCNFLFSPCWGYQHSFLKEILDFNNCGNSWFTLPCQNPRNYTTDYKPDTLSTTQCCSIDFPAWPKRLLIFHFPRCDVFWQFTSESHTC